MERRIDILDTVWSIFLDYSHFKLFTEERNAIVFNSFVISPKYVFYLED